MVEQFSRQLDQLKSKDQDSAAVIRLLREKMDDFEKESQRRQKHQHQLNSGEMTSSSRRKTEDRGVQADWQLLLDTEAEVMINRPLQRLSVPDLTRPRQRIGSKSHSVDDDDETDAVDSEGAATRLDQKWKELEEELKLANDRILSCKLREANLLAHLKDYRQRSENLNRLISLRDAHIGRLEEEINRLKDALVEGRGKEKELQSFISDLQLTLNDLKAKYEEHIVLGQLRDSEHQQVVESLQQQLARIRDDEMYLSAGHGGGGGGAGSHLDPSHRNKSSPLRTTGQAAAHLSKNAVHFQSTGCLLQPAAAADSNSAHSYEKVLQHSYA